MPVSYTLTGVPSNKPEGEKKKQAKILDKKISYIPITGQVAVLKPIIDKISITYKIDDPALKPILIESLMQETEKGGVWKKANKFSVGGAAYSASGQLVVPPNGFTAFLQLYPKKTVTKHDLRLDFNPAALGALGIGFLKQRLEALALNGLSYGKILTNGVVTRLDVAVDVVGVHLADLVISHKTGGKQHWYLADLGKPETGYLGIKKSDKNAKFVTYNKRQELKDHYSGSLPMVQAYGGLSRTRIEFHAITPNKTFLDLKGYNNPFTKISVAYAPAPKGIKPYLWSFFIDSCMRRGEAAALAMLPEGHLRKKYSNGLNSAHAIFWRPDVIWGAWENTLLNSGLIQD